MKYECNDELDNSKGRGSFFYIAQYPVSKINQYALLFYNLKHRSMCYALVKFTVFYIMHMGLHRAYTIVRFANCFAKCIECVIHGTLLQYFSYEWVITCSL